MREGAAATFGPAVQEIRHLVTEPRFTHPWRPAPTPPVDLYTLQRVLAGLRRLLETDALEAAGNGVGHPRINRPSSGAPRRWMGGVRP